MHGAETTQVRPGQRRVAVIYLRVSTVDQEKRGFSIPEQRKACQEKAQALVRAAEQEVLETHEFVDTAGGDLIERPELTRAREFVKQWHPDYFVCLDPDRFSRATYQAILVANEIEAAGTRLEFVQHDYQATSEGRLFFTLRVAIAEYEKAKIMERTGRGKRGKMAAGGIPHHIRVYGYDYLTTSERQIRTRQGMADPGALLPNPTEAAWVRQMLEWVAREEIGSQAVADRLNLLAVPSKTGGLWRRGVVADILRNPIYIGRLRLNRYDSAGLGGQMQLPPARRTRKMTARLRAPDEWITVAVPPVVDQALFDRAQAVLTRMKRRSSTRIQPGRKGHLLSGLLTCGLCGGPLHYVWNNKSNHYLLRCGHRYPPVRGEEACSLPHIRAAPLEEAVWNEIASWLRDPELLSVELERQQTEPDRADRTGKAALLTGQIAETKDRQSRVLYLVRKGVVHLDVAEAQLAELKRHLEGLEHEAAALRQAVEQTTQGGQPAGVGGTVCEQQEVVLGAMAEMDLAQRQTLVRMLIREVIVRGRGRVAITPVL